MRCAPCPAGPGSLRKSVKWMSRLAANGQDRRLPPSRGRPSRLSSAAGRVARCASATGVLPSGRQARRCGRTDGRRRRRRADRSRCPRVREIVRHLFCEERIVGDVWLRLLREAVGVVELIGTGEPDDLRQRLVPRPADLRIALRPPRDATGGDGERDDRGRNPRAARRPRPRDRRPIVRRRQPRVTRRSEIAHARLR